MRLRLALSVLSLARGYDRLVLNLFSLDRVLLEKVSHMSFGYDNFFVFVHGKMAFCFPERGALQTSLGQS